MSQGLIGRKVGMTSLFLEDGSQVPVTVLEAGPCKVLFKRTLEKDRYSALALGFGAVRKKPDGTARVDKPTAGRFAKLGAEPVLVTREFRVKPEEAAKVEVGAVLKADFFKKGQLVDVSGVSKGRGFSGVFKRHHMKGAARDSASSHEHHRHMGAVGQRKTPGKVWKNKRMPGRMGQYDVTVQNLAVVDVDADNNIVVVQGSVPGHDHDLVVIHPAVKGDRKKGAAHTPSAKSAKKAPAKK